LPIVRAGARIEKLEAELVFPISMTMDSRKLTRVAKTLRGRRIGVAGDFMLDRYVWGSATRLSPEAPVPVVDFMDESQVLGGAGNVAANLAALGASVLPFGVIGEDEAGRAINSCLEARGISTKGILADRSRITTVKTRVVAKHHQIVRIDRERRDLLGHALEERLIRRIKMALAKLDALVISDYDKGVITPVLISNVVEECRIQGRPVLAQPKVRHYLDYIGVTMVKSNVREATIATGVSMVNDTSLRNMGHNLMSRLECESLLLTRSEQGMILFEKKNITSFPALKGPKPGFNAVGVRDCMTAVLAMSLASGAKMRDAFLAERDVEEYRGSRSGADREGEETALFAVDGVGEAQGFSSGTGHDRDYGAELGRESHGGREGQAPPLRHGNEGTKGRARVMA